jgi:hypothetical protein
MKNSFGVHMVIATLLTGGIGGIGGCTKHTVPIPSTSLAPETTMTDRQVLEVLVQSQYNLMQRQEQLEAAIGYLHNEQLNDTFSTIKR